jgi:histidine triad (HIT) family protein
MSDCVFCDIIAGKQTPANFHDYGPVVRFQPLNPVVPGHRLFVPTLHVATAADDPQLTALVVGYAAEYASGAADDFNLIVNNGPAASQTVPHLHWHVVPRVEGDGLHLPWSGQQSESTR